MMIVVSFLCVEALLIINKHDPHCYVFFFLRNSGLVGAVCLGGHRLIVLKQGEFKKASLHHASLLRSTRDLPIASRVEEQGNVVVGFCCFCVRFFVVVVLLCSGFFA